MMIPSFPMTRFVTRPRNTQTHIYAQPPTVLACRARVVFISAAAKNQKTLHSGCFSRKSEMRDIVFFLQLIIYIPRDFFAPDRPPRGTSTLLVSRSSLTKHFIHRDAHYRSPRHLFFTIGFHALSFATALDRSIIRSHVS